MKTNTALAVFENFPYFTMEGFRQVAEESQVKPVSIPVILFRWMKTGKIIQIKKGVYMARRFYELYSGELNFAPAVSAVIRPQSYVSLEYVLQREGILTEITYPVTAVSMKNTWVIENDLGTFAYRHIKPEMYLGYQMGEFHGVPFAIASRAKALFDYLYLRPAPLALSYSGYNLADDLRLNLEEFLPRDRDEFAGYVNRSRQRKLERILVNLKETIWRP